MTFARISPQMGHFYHVYNRGNNRQNIFFERENYFYFLRLIRQTFVAHDVDVVAYCLMPNHYHLLVYPQSERLSQAMKSLSLAYIKAINKRFNRFGSLFQGRFQRILITDSEYLVQLIRYIHTNLNCDRDRLRSPCLRYPPYQGGQRGIECNVFATFSIQIGIT